MQEECISSVGHACSSHARPAPAHEFRAIIQLQSSVLPGKLPSLLGSLGSATLACKQRIWRCHQCRVVHDWYINAARNILLCYLMMESVKTNKDEGSWCRCYRSTLVELSCSCNPSLVTVRGLTFGCMHLCIGMVRTKYILVIPLHHSPLGWLVGSTIHSSRAMHWPSRLTHGTTETAAGLTTDLRAAGRNTWHAVRTQWHSCYEKSRRYTGLMIGSHRGGFRKN